jgi:hypothetical protein
MEMVTNIIAVTCNAGAWGFALQQNQYGKIWVYVDGARKYDKYDTVKALFGAPYTVEEMLATYLDVAALQLPAAQAVIRFLLT